MAERALRNSGAAGAAGPRSSWAQIPGTAAQINPATAQAPGGRPADLAAGAAGIERRSRMAREICPRRANGLAGAYLLRISRKLNAVPALAARRFSTRSAMFTPETIESPNEIPSR